MSELNYPEIYSNLTKMFYFTEEDLKNQPFKKFQHSAWDYCGYVYWDSELNCFVEEVWQLHQKKRNMLAENLEGLIKMVQQTYGSE